MNKGVKLTSLLLLAVVLGTLATPAMAVSQDECAIWLCLPGGFPGGCGAAHAAMEHRVSHLKPPLPPFSACSADSGGSMSYQQGRAAYVPRQRYCVSGDRNRCFRYRQVEAHWVDGARCDNYGDGAFVNTNPGGGRTYTHPDGPRCSSTSRTITIFDHGEQLGNTFYWTRR